MYTYTDELPFLVPLLESPASPPSLPPELRTLLDQCGIYSGSSTLLRLLEWPCLPSHPPSVLWMERTPYLNGFRSAPAWVNEFLPLAGCEP